MRIYRSILFLVFAGSARAASLQPDELLLIYNADLAASRELAAYYAEVRRVPTEQMIGLELGNRGEEISSSDFERLIRQPVGAFLKRRRLDDKIRCLVTFFGVPIRVSKMVMNARQMQLRARWQQEIAGLWVEWEKAIAQMEVIATSQPAASRPAAQGEKSIPAFVKRYKEIRAAAMQRIAGEGQTPENVQRYQLLMKMLTNVEGEGGIIAQLSLQGDPNTEAGRQLAAMREQAVAMETRIRELLSHGADSPQREEARPLIRQHWGILGTLRSLESDIERFRDDESESAVDSELSLLWWADYPRYRWAVNPLCWRNRASEDLHRTLPTGFWDRKVVMTARIDASTPEIARRMIDDAIAAERKGLAGRVYVDARGMTKKDSMVEFDKDLILLAHGLRKRTELSVKSDDHEAVFAQGSCPEAMLYCGWYSLRKFIDAFDFVPGAVGYHVASFEAVSLKKPGESGWCKSLLEDGVAATLGSVAEPYLHSFPKPTEFFGLLLTGQFSLAECFAYTNPFNSWMMMLLGDPLYRPFANNPVLKLEQAIEPKLITAGMNPMTRPAATSPSAE